MKCLYNITKNGANEEKYESRKRMEAKLQPETDGGVERDEKTGSL